MDKEVIATGKTLEEAKDSAVKQLGVKEQDIQFEVIELPTKKKFGLFGGNSAKVKAFIKSAKTADNAKTNCNKPVKNNPDKSKKKNANTNKNKKVSLATSTKSSDNGNEYLNNILKYMGAKKFTVTSTTDDSTISYQIEAANPGLIIGRKGETLDAIQYLVSLNANNTNSDFCRVHLNVGNYREKREDNLVSLAGKLGEKAKREHRKVFLDPMNPYERRIVHTEVQKIEGLTSWSEGEGIGRHIIIAPKDMPKGNSSEHRNRNYNKRRPNRNIAKKADEVGTYGKITDGEKVTASPSVVDDFDFTMKNEAPVSPLYGKIEPKNE